ncbi:type III-A CRISPR-associated RAMP protein Csm3 [Dolosicoccus paucivorans]|uniref:CRISPR system Cms endoribonuclease Csm3 n=1 Tax=Dolosicoccus paucivorans TaxID=84521 RepID=A0A1G8JUQ6_9LACT|nr:type III-A CRISPR-associated RAMP protein Csm3 [Dolosicoccus paucivorans]PMB85055.1 type III-A CRISPR-associated RAMP protein Csm3 [Dolosicoccus paucivorans]PMC58989.1 type III-A CRISPR-associated RAMP protein Csm3 [Dolosicoccus paucivorans]SDI34918.1 CRISPR-associated protein, Csm3 family [Dolosicoccus paucivorans]
MKRIKAKVRITGTLRLQTGLHIGSSSAFAAIGATDSPIIKDPLTNLPIIPGSSLKGKMRSLLARTKNEKVANQPDEDHETIRRLFGDAYDHKQAALIFNDLFLINEQELMDRGAELLTEVKFENTIDRRTAGAKPRQIERAIAGSEFGIDLIYNVSDLIELDDDFSFILDGFKLLTLDYLGGSGTRGYGRVEFSDFQAEVVIGELGVEALQMMNDKLSTI